MLPKRVDDVEEALLPRIAAGDRDAIRAFVARYGSLVWSIARRFEPEQAEDAVQEIFLDLWRAAARFDPAIAREATFVAMISRRRLIDRRRHSARQVPAVPLVEATAIADNAVSPERAALMQQTTSALSQLRPEQRDIVLLCTQGWSHSEIAAQRGIPLGTVKAHARRGLLAVRAALGKARGEDS